MGLGDFIPPRTETCGSRVGLHVPYRLRYADLKRIALWCLVPRHFVWLRFDRLVALSVCQHSDISPGTPGEVTVSMNGNISREVAEIVARSCEKSWT